MQLKHIIITGGTGGIGLATARMVAETGVSVTLISRDANKGRHIVSELREHAKNKNIDFVVADLSSQQQIRQAAEKIINLHPVIDILVNNAGIWNSDFMLTGDGIEEMFAVNHLSYFLLTHCLIKGLKRSSSARIINVSSDSHFNGKIHWDDLNLTRHYHGLRAYGQSKLANVLFTYGFARKNPGYPITINAVQPGLVKTNIGIKHTNLFHALAWRLRRTGGVSPEQGAATSVYLALSPEIEGVTGKYWDRCKAKNSSTASYSIEDAIRLWNICEELCGIKNYFS